MPEGQRQADCDVIKLIFDYIEKDFPQIKEIALHLDNDMAGRLAAKAIQAILPPAYAVSDEPPERGKDYNDYLRIVLRIRQQQERELL